MNLRELKNTLVSDLQEEGVNLTREEAYDQKRCVQCGKDASQFKDAISAKEYRQTIWCQACQDAFFG